MSSTAQRWSRRTSAASERAPPWKAMRYSPSQLAASRCARSAIRPPRLRSRRRRCLARHRRHLHHHPQQQCPHPYRAAFRKSRSCRSLSTCPRTSRSSTAPACHRCTPIQPRASPLRRWYSRVPSPPPRRPANPISSPPRAAPPKPRRKPPSPRPRNADMAETYQPEPPPLRDSVKKRVKSLFVVASFIAVVSGSIQIAGNFLNFGISGTQTAQAPAPQPDKIETVAETTEPQTTPTVVVNPLALPQLPTAPLVHARSAPAAGTPLENFNATVAMPSLFNT